MKYKNIIFDLDGTLWDSTASIAQNWTNVLTKYELLEKPLNPTDMNSYMGLLIGDVLQDIFPEISEELKQKLIAEIIEKERKSLLENGGTLYEGVQETLEELSKNHQLFIVSNALDGYIQAFLDYFKFNDFFRDFESHGKTGRNKAENIALVMSRNELKNSETVYVGDTQTDYLSATENELDFIFCNYGFGKLEESNKSLKINQITELLNLV